MSADTDSVAFVNGRIMTMRPGGAAPDVVVVRGERIAEVGGAAVLERHHGIAVVDLGGRVLCPGFIDAHHHLSLAALEPAWADARGVTSMEELAARLQAQAAASPSTPWIRAAGWSEIGSGFEPRRADLDSLGLDRPVLVAHYSLHQGVTDSRGLEALGIGARSADPDGGELGRAPDGSLDGRLIERAWSEAHRRSLAPYDDPDRWAEHIDVAARALLADGITAVHDAACSPGAESAYGTLARAGRLAVSVLMLPHPAALLGPLDERRLDGPPTGEGSETLRVGPVKLFADGGVAPAIDVHLGGAPLRVGMLFDGLGAQMDAAVDRGFRVAVHAIGNAGLEATLDAFEATARRRPGTDHRFRVEHACLASAGQLGRLARLGGVAVVQPGFLHHLGGQVEGVHLDDAEWLPFGDMVRAGLTMAASSDCPCTFHEPLRTSAHGASRRTSSGAVLDAGQAVSFEDWLWAYTAGAALAGGQEHERGSIAPGLRADFVVLDGELDAQRPPTVAQTWLGGRQVYAP